MSDVARYVAAGDGVVKTDPAGPLVKWNDYARLQADAQVLLKHLDEASLDCARLKAEVERLREAGDEMEKVIILAECIAGVEHTEKSALAWLAAKEGKQP